MEAWSSLEQGVVDRGLREQRRHCYYLGCLHRLLPAYAARAYVSVKKSDVSVSVRSLVCIDTHFVKRNQERKTIIVFTSNSFF